MSQVCFSKSGPATRGCASRELTAETLAEETSVFVREKAVGTLAARQGAVLQRRTQQGANGLVGRF